MTYSIVARDPETGQLGVAVQSHWFNTGAVVSWAEAGVGVVATQSFVEQSFGPRGLGALRAGETPTDALAGLLDGDDGAHARQVALVDVHGHVAVHTGDRCIASAGHEVGDGWSVQANMMVDDGVVPAMAEAFTTTSGSLGARLLAALAAAQSAGGDLRGQQSAALCVVTGTATGDPARDVVVDLRVEDHATPVAELHRLHDLAVAYGLMNAGDEALERDDLAAALAAYDRAATLQPSNAEFQFWTALTLATNGRLEDAVPVLRRALDDGGERWAVLLRRLPAAGLCDESVATRLLTLARRDVG